MERMEATTSIPDNKEAPGIPAIKRVSIQSLLNSSETNLYIDGFEFTASQTITTVPNTKIEIDNSHMGTIVKVKEPKQGTEEESDSNGNKSTKKRAKSNLMLEMCSELWMKHYTRLREYYKLYGNTNVTRTKPEWKTLGNWVAEQRRKMKNGKLSKEQLDMLNELGFEWDRHQFFKSKKNLTGDNNNNSDSVENTY